MTASPYNGQAPYQAGSDTSQAAAEAIEPSRNRLREAVYSYIDACGPDGATTDQVVTATGIPVQTVTARVRELTLLGRIRDSGERRKTQSGRTAAVRVAHHYPPF